MHTRVAACLVEARSAEVERRHRELRHRPPQRQRVRGGLHQAQGCLHDYTFLFVKQLNACLFLCQEKKTMK